MFASPDTHATSTTATAEARSAGNLALPPGQELSRESWLRGEGRNLQLRSRRDPRRGTAARRRRRIEARLQSRAGAARHQPDGGLRSGLARRAFHRTPRPRARPARAQTLPVARFWLARRVDERPRRGAGRARALAAPPRRKAPLAPRRRTSAASRRSRSRRKLQGADHDRVPPAGARVRSVPVWRSATHIRDQNRHTGCAEDSAAQRLRLVFPRRARQVCPYAGRDGRAVALAAAAGVVVLGDIGAVRAGWAGLMCAFAKKKSPGK